MGSETWRSNIWRYNNGKGFSTKDSIAYKHPAIFPEKLVDDHILSWSNPGDIVLDPFGGSGTTAKEAIKSLDYIDKRLKPCSFCHLYLLPNL